MKPSNLREWKISKSSIKGNTITIAYTGRSSMIKLKIKRILKTNQPAFKGGLFYVILYLKFKKGGTQMCNME